MENRATKPTKVRAAGARILHRHAYSVSSDLVESLTLTLITNACHSEELSLSRGRVVRTKSGLSAYPASPGWASGIPNVSAHSRFELFEVFQVFP